LNFLLSITASFVFLILPLAAKFAHFAAPPFPIETAALGFVGDPAALLIFSALQHRKFITSIVVRVGRVAFDPMEVDLVIGA